MAVGIIVKHEDGRMGESYYSDTCPFEGKIIVQFYNETIKKAIRKNLLKIIGYIDE